MDPNTPIPGTLLIEWNMFSHVTKATSSERVLLYVYCDMKFNSSSRITYAEVKSSGPVFVKNINYSTKINKISYICDMYTVDSIISVIEK